MDDILESECDLDLVSAHGTFGHGSWLMRCGAGALDDLDDQEKSAAESQAAAAEKPVVSVPSQAAQGLLGPERPPSLGGPTAGLGDLPPDLDGTMTDLMVRARASCSPSPSSQTLPARVVTVLGGVAEGARGRRSQEDDGGGRAEPGIQNAHGRPEQARATERRCRPRASQLRKPSPSCPRGAGEGAGESTPGATDPALVSARAIPSWWRAPLAPRAGAAGGGGRGRVANHP
jgi:hypothetical protein